MVSLGIVIIVLTLVHENLTKYYYKEVDGTYDVYFGPKQIWGYKEFKPPKSFKVDFDNRGDRPGKCENGDFMCREPYIIKETEVFECEVDYQCPRYFKCCQPNCFQHKICQPASEQEDEELSEVPTSSPMPITKSSSAPVPTTKSTKPATTTSTASTSRRTTTSTTFKTTTSTATTVTPSTKVTGSITKRPNTTISTSTVTPSTKVTGSITKRPNTTISIATSFTTRTPYTSEGTVNSTTKPSTSTSESTTASIKFTIPLTKPFTKTPTEKEETISINTTLTTPSPRSNLPSSTVFTTRSTNLTTKLHSSTKPTTPTPTSTRASTKTTKNVVASTESSTYSAKPPSNVTSPTTPTTIGDISTKVTLKPLTTVKPPTTTTTTNVTRIPDEPSSLSTSTQSIGKETTIDIITDDEDFTASGDFELISDISTSVEFETTKLISTSALKTEHMNLTTPIRPTSFPILTESTTRGVITEITTKNVSKTTLDEGITTSGKKSTLPSEITTGTSDDEDLTFSGDYEVDTTVVSNLLSTISDHSITNQETIIPTLLVKSLEQSTLSSSSSSEINVTRTTTTNLSTKFKDMSSTFLDNITPTVTSTKYVTNNDTTTKKEGLTHNGHGNDTFTDEKFIVTDDEDLVFSGDGVTYLSTDDGEVISTLLTEHVPTTSSSITSKSTEPGQTIRPDNITLTTSTLYFTMESSKRTSISKGATELHTTMSKPSTSISNSYSSSTTIGDDVKQTRSSEEKQNAAKRNTTIAITTSLPDTNTSQNYSSSTPIGSDLIQTILNKPKENLAVTELPKENTTITPTTLHHYTSTSKNSGSSTMVGTDLTQPVSNKENENITVTESSKENTTMTPMISHHDRNTSRIYGSSTIIGTDLTEATSADKENDNIGKITVSATTPATIDKNFTTVPTPLLITTVTNKYVDNETTTTIASVNISTSRSIPYENKVFVVNTFLEHLRKLPGSIEDASHNNIDPYFNTFLRFFGKVPIIIEEATKNHTNYILDKADISGIRYEKEFSTANDKESPTGKFLNINDQGNVDEINDEPKKLREESPSKIATDNGLNIANLDSDSDPTDLIISETLNGRKRVDSLHRTVSDESVTSNTYSNHESISEYKERQKYVIPTEESTNELDFPVLKII